MSPNILELSMLVEGKASNLNSLLGTNKVSLLTREQTPRPIEGLIMSSTSRIPNRFLLVSQVLECKMSIRQSVKEDTIKCCTCTTNNYTSIIDILIAIHPTMAMCSLKQEEMQPIVESRAIQGHVWP